MITLKDANLKGFVDTLPDATQEIIERSDRPIDDSQSNNSLRSNCLTFLLSPKVKSVTTKINGQERTYGVFAVAYVKEDGSVLGTGTVSANSLIRNYYPNQGEATNPLPMIVNNSNFGNTALSIAQKLYESDSVIRFKEKKGVYSPVWNSIAETMEYSNMTKRDRSFFEIVPMPADLKTKLES